MRLEGRDIAVIGAGIGGLAAAIALAARRANVVVFERAAALAEVGAGIQVGPNGVAVLEALGLRDAAEAHASLPEAVTLTDHRTGRRVARVPLGRRCVARYGRPYWHLHRADLLAVLAAAAAEQGVEIRLAAPVDAVDPAGDHVTVTVAHTVPHGGPARFDLAVAADGVRSGLRAARFGGPPPRFTGHVAWRGLVETARLPAGLVGEGAQVAMGPRRHLVTYPLRGGRMINFVAVEERDRWIAEGWTTADDPDRLRAAFAGWPGAAGPLLAAVESTYLWGLFDHPPLPRWTSGRLALLGDACHPMLPFLAQGAAMALEDAWVLAAELDVAETPERGLLAYEARRRPRTTRAQRAAARSGRIYHLPEGVRGLAHLGLAAASALAPGLLLAQFDWLYGADVVSAEATA